MANVEELSDANFHAKLTESEISFVDIYASWCGPCRLFSPTFEQVAQKYPNDSFFKIDGDKNPGCRQDLTIENLPYIAAYRRGEFVGGLSTSTESALEEFIQKVHRQGGE